MKLLYGEYDGGGLTALAFAAEHVVSAGREGGCVLWRVTASGQLQHVAALQDGSEASSPVVSSLVLTSAADAAVGGGDSDSDVDSDSDRDSGGGSDGGGGVEPAALTVWAGCVDGSVRRWEVGDGTWTQRGTHVRRDPLRAATPRAGGCSPACCSLQPSAARLSHVECHYPRCARRVRF